MTSPSTLNNGPGLKAPEAQMSTTSAHRASPVPHYHPRSRNGSQDHQFRLENPSKADLLVEHWDRLILKLEGVPSNVIDDFLEQQIQRRAEEDLCDNDMECGCDKRPTKRPELPDREKLANEANSLLSDMKYKSGCLIRGEKPPSTEHLAAPAGSAGSQLWQHYFCLMQRINKACEEGVDPGSPRSTDPGQLAPPT